MSGWYHGRPVLVIGGLGFIGSNLTRGLISAGARVTALTRSLAAHPGLGPQLAAEGATLAEADVRDAAAMTRAVAGQSVVFNLSGQSGAVRSIEDPRADLDVNFRGQLVVLEALRHANPSARIVFASSRLHYGHQATLPVPEDAPSNPLSFHALHKSAAEQATRMHARLFGMPATIARITNPYGPGQPRARTAYGVINRLVHLAVTGDVLTIYGHGKQLRDYIHVSDVAAGLLAMGESAAADGRTYNIGSGTGTALIDAARAIIEIAGGGRVEHVDWPAMAERVETGDFVADIARARAELGWSPTIGLRHGLEQTVTFYREGMPA